MKQFIIILSLCLSGCTKIKFQNEKKFLTSDTEFKVKGKSRGYFQIDVINSSENENTLTLEAVVKALQNSENVNIEWKLPASATILSGEPFNQLDFMEGDTNTFKIELSKNDLKKEQLIFFYAYTVKAGERHGSSFTYSYESQLNDETDSNSIKTLKTRKQQKFLE